MMRRGASAVRFVVCMLGVAGASLLVGCAAMLEAPSHARTGYDVIGAHDADGRAVVILPATGVMLREGANESEDVQVEWTMAHSVSPGRMLVYSADRSRLLVNVSAGDVDLSEFGLANEGLRTQIAKITHPSHRAPSAVE